MYKAEAVTNYNVLSQNFPGGTVNIRKESVKIANFQPGFRPRTSRRLIRPITAAPIHSEE